MHFTNDLNGVESAFQAVSSVDNSTVDEVSYNVELSKNLLKQFHEMHGADAVLPSAGNKAFDHRSAEFEPHSSLQQREFVDNVHAQPWTQPPPTHFHSNFRQEHGQPFEKHSYPSTHRPQQRYAPPTYAEPHYGNYKYMPPSAELDDFSFHKGTGGSAQYGQHQGYDGYQYEYQKHESSPSNYANWQAPHYDDFDQYAYDMQQMQQQDRCAHSFHPQHQQVTPPFHQCHYQQPQPRQPPPYRRQFGQMPAEVRIQHKKAHLDDRMLQQFQDLSISPPRTGPADFVADQRAPLYHGPPRDYDERVSGRFESPAGAVDRLAIAHTEQALQSSHSDPLFAAHQLRDGHNSSMADLRGNASLLGINNAASSFKSEASTRTECSYSDDGRIGVGKLPAHFAIPTLSRATSEQTGRGVALGSQRQPSFIDSYLVHLSKQSSVGNASSNSLPRTEKEDESDLERSQSAVFGFNASGSVDALSYSSALWSGPGADNGHSSSSYNLDVYSSACINNNFNNNQTYNNNIFQKDTSNRYETKSELARSNYTLDNSLNVDDR